MLNIYVASSWRNNHHGEVIKALRANPAITCYDFKFEGFSWDQVNPHWSDQASNFKTYMEMLRHPLAIEGFARDLDAMEYADVFILVLPAGRSANLEAGWAIGQGKPTAVYMPEYDTPDLMYKMADLITNNIDELTTWALNLIDEYDL